jgi:hypothetical protein
MIEVCVEFPQFHQVYYSEMFAGNKLEDEINKLLKEKQEKIGRDLSGSGFKVICKGCGEQSDIKKEVCRLFQSHFGIEVFFDKLGQTPKRKYLTKVQI